MPALKRIGLTVKRRLDGKAAIVAKVLGMLRDAGIEVYVDPARTDDVPAAKAFKVLTKESNVDAILTFGGDGTILRAVREYAALGVPFITINRGRLGFLADMTLQQAVKSLPMILKGNGIREQRSQFVVEVRRGKKTVFRGMALNEVVVAQGAIARLIELPTTVDGEELTTFRADGLIVSTPTGSTAYNLAAGGPVLHPALAAIILTAINPHSFSHKPLVLPGKQSVTIHVKVQENEQRTEVGLSLDGQEYFCLAPDDVITVRLGRKGVTFLRAAKTSYFTVLREKLRWGKGPETADA